MDVYIFTSQVSPQPSKIPGYDMWTMGGEFFTDGDALADAILCDDVEVKPCPFGYAYADGHGDVFDIDGAQFETTSVEVVENGGAWVWYVVAEIVPQ